MKLRNKKTGEIGLMCYTSTDDGSIIIQNINAKDNCECVARYHSLSELNEEWEDVPEEPKGYWYINEFGTPTEITHTRENIYDTQRKNFGNYFETREEAELAVRKLKAWKRLKDKGFRFDLLPALGHCDDKKFDISIIGTMPAKWWYNDKVVDDIHYVFGGEE